MAAPASQEGAVAVTLKLEAVADHLADMAVQVRKNPEIRRRIPVRLWKYTYGPSWRPWVAEIVGVNENGRPERRFLDGQKDFSEANGIGSRGVYYYYHLLPGRTYEVREILSWTKDRRYFCRVEGDRIIEVERGEAFACLP